MDSIFSTACPCCGAPVAVYSATAVVVVCQYCQSSLVRTEQSLNDSGKKSAIIEDYSPLQLYSSGTFEGKAFTLIGRSQIRYDRGVWNEWYALFSDGSYGWLSESGDQYVFTRLQGKLPPAYKLSFQQLKAGKSVLNYQTVRYMAADVRQATAVHANAQGELPYPVKQDQALKVADFRSEQRFITLDFSDNGQQPIVYAGTVTTLDALHCQNLRSKDTILQQAGKLKGEHKASQCPQCGSRIIWAQQMTKDAICKSCHAHIDLSTDQARVIEVYNFRQKTEKAFSLSLGETGKIDDVRWTVIGLVKKTEIESSDAWRIMLGESSRMSISRESWLEYLLYNSKKGFLWLIETTQHEWAISTTLNQWPKLNLNQQPYNENGQLMGKLYDYGGRVDYAAGAFYWQIQPDDITCYSDYGTEQLKVCAEYSKHEMAWSTSKAVSAQQVATWFQKPALRPLSATTGHRATTDYRSQAALNRVNRKNKLQQKSAKGTAIFLLLAYGLINLPAFFMSFSSTISLLIVCGVSYLIYVLLGKPFDQEA